MSNPPLTRNICTYSFSHSPIPILDWDLGFGNWELDLSLTIATKHDEIRRGTAREGRNDATFLRHSIGGIKGDESDVKQGPGETNAL